MKPFSKITLSADEQQLVNNTEWILTKRKIMDKVNLLLGDVSVRQQQIIENKKKRLPAEVLQSTPKIAKGENYLQLPYMLLDYPRCFNDENIFAVRTMFWWGNFFSITLHLSGNYKEMFQQKVISNLQEDANNYFICINENQWQHHFEADNYISIKNLQKDELQNLIVKKAFVKLAVQFPLQAWNDIPSLLENSFNQLITMLRD